MILISLFQLWTIDLDRRTKKYQLQLETLNRSTPWTPLRL